MKSSDGEVVISLHILIFMAQNRDFVYTTNSLRATKSRDIFSSLYGCMLFIIPIWLHLILSLIKNNINHIEQCYRIRNEDD